jgi:hypothetical protein
MGTTYRGEVVLRRIGIGSKSERLAVLLVTQDAEWVLRRQGGHPLRDPVLEALVGKTIQCEGEVASYALIVSSWEVVGAPGEKGPSQRRVRRRSPA